MKTDSAAATGLLYDIKRAGELVCAGLVSLIKERPRHTHGHDMPHDQGQLTGLRSDAIHEDNIAYEEPVYGGERVQTFSAAISLYSDEPADEEPYDPTWLHRVIYFVNRPPEGGL